MNKETLQGRLNAEKQKSFKLLKEEALYLGFCEERGFMYELKKEIYGVLNRIVLSINKKNSIVVHEKEDIEATKKVINFSRYTKTASA
ncbi:Uncharacterised protein [Lysinibacillus capsici]|uniref:Uncharacterized protein n=1 Tax=Lysinibacillus capsici TaxID=2115968 RepID=A0A2X1A8X0_9BACI|nr:hypothetical protein [Lysinibacillus capsici]SPU40729.1 Uncharacterised protein [Lysinibacillus capsici]